MRAAARWTEVPVLTPYRHWLLTVTLLGAALGFTTGCATGSTTHHGIAAGQWQARLPETKSPIASLAFGRGGNGTPAQLSELELAALVDPTPDDVLQPMAAAKTVGVAKPALRRALASNTLAAQPEAVTAEPAPTPAAASVTAQPTLLASNDSNPQQRYADREQQSKQQQQFRGGDAIIISGGVLLVILLIVLLVLLLR